MRINEYNSLSEFTSQYIGVWGPSDRHWFGLDFSYHGKEYRFHTGIMSADESETLKDGRNVLFGLYMKETSSDKYKLLGQFATMDDVLKSKVIENTVFKNVIMADETELLGQD